MPFHSVQVHIWAYVSIPAGSHLVDVGRSPSNRGKVGGCRSHAVCHRTPSRPFPSPRKMSLIACMRCWPATDACRPLVGIFALAGVGPPARILRLLSPAGYSGSVSSRPLIKKHDPRSAVNAPDTDYLSSYLDETELVEDMATVRLQSALISPWKRLSHCGCNLVRLDLGVQLLVQVRVRAGPTLIRRWPSTTVVSWSRALYVRRPSELFGRSVSARLRRASGATWGPRRDQGVSSRFRCLVPNVEVPAGGELRHTSRDRTRPYR